MYVMVDLLSTASRFERLALTWGIGAEGMWLTPNQPLDCYALISYLFVICIVAFRLQWNPIAPSNQQCICSKTKSVIIITLMNDLG